MPADTLPSHFTTEFTHNWIARIAQTQPRLANYFDAITINGERKRFDRIAGATSQKRTTRKGATPVDSRTTDSRWAYLEDYEIPAYMVDKSDEANLGVLTLPNSQVVMDNAARYSRDCDDLVCTTAIGSVKTGELGTTPTAFPAGQQIVHGSTGMTLAKLISANELFVANEIDPMSEKVIVITSNQLTDLLGIAEIRDADFNSVKALVQGKVDTYMGFKFIINNRLTLSGSTRSCVAMVKGAVKMVKGSMSTTIDRRPDLSNATQIYSQYRLGATRVHDEAVVEIQCTEA